MYKTTLRRVIRAGYMNFRRNGWLSTATILVMTLVLFVLGWLMILSVVANVAISSVESKIDISVYFKSKADENDILTVKDELSILPEVAKIDYISPDQALTEFRDRHRGSKLIADSLEELGENPLAPSLNIKARDSKNYAAISKFLASKNYPTVDKINYFENQKVIERLSSIVGTTKVMGASLVIFLAFIAVLVAFNTVRLAIYTMREEISIMRLVGATSWFIRGPFLFEGMLYGVISSLVATASFFPALWVVSPSVALVMPDTDLFRYFIENFLEFFGLILGAGVGLGVVSSFIAIRRYLMV